VTDSIVYGKYVLVPWNIVRYNVFSGSSRGPNLFGTSPWNFYILNLLLNFNVLLPLALVSLPALLTTYRIYGKVGLQPVRGQSSSFTLLSIRLAPFYVWLAILMAQEHKEERFMYPIYPLLCFNAAVTLYLMRGWLETAFIKLTKSPYKVSPLLCPQFLLTFFKASKSSIFRTFTSSVITGSALLSLFRILALWKYYHAPMTVFYVFQAQELPRLLKEANLLPPSPEMEHNDQPPHIDLSPIKRFDLRLCLGKEWHRFPGHYLVPDGVKVDFIKSEFDGILPGHFQTNNSVGDDRWWLLEALRTQPEGLNDLNIEEASHYVR
jgi:alpha-1,2-mannosyltransferase